MIPSIPGCVVDKRQFAEIVALLQCGDGALAVDHHVDGALQQNVPRTTLVALIEHCTIHRNESIVCYIRLQSYRSYHKSYSLNIWW